MPAAVVHASRIAGSAGAVRLAGPERDRAAVGDEQRVERVDEVGVAGRSVPRTWTVGPSEASTSTNASCSRWATSRSTGDRNPWAGSSNARPNAGPGRLTRTSRSVGGHALGAVAARGHRHPRRIAAGPAAEYAGAHDGRLRRERAHREGRATPRSTGRRGRRAASRARASRIAPSTAPSTSSGRPVERPIIAERWSRIREVVGPDDVLPVRRGQLALSAIGSGHRPEPGRVERRRRRR